MGIVKLTQYILPHGTPKIVGCKLPDYICKMAKDQILSCEWLPIGVVLYSRLSGEDEEKEDVEFAINGPGKNSPRNMLSKLIKRVYQRNNKRKVEHEA